jgi:hypothetical protein
MQASVRLQAERPDSNPAQASGLAYPRRRLTRRAVRREVRRATLRDANMSSS